LPGERSVRRLAFRFCFRAAIGLSL
jgi:hypothetical protein